MVNIKINNIACQAPEGSTILEAARLAGIKIPTLCYLKEINAIGACRICVVEIKGGRSLAAACVHPISEGMEIFTNSPTVLESRKMTLQLLLSTHDRRCLSCVRSGTCELQTLCSELGVDDEQIFEGENPKFEIDTSSIHMYRDNNKCINCRRCVAACEITQGIGVIGANERGFATFIGSPFDMGLAETACVSCGQCIAVCPTGALSENDSTAELWDALADPEKTVIVQTAPAVRASLGEAFGYDIGTNVEGKMVSALRKLGFDKVFDTNFSADLTIMEEANEFLDRFQNGGTLPLITSCSPGWVRYCEAYFPDLIPNLSSCKSPQQMFGAVTKTYYAQKMGIDPKSIVSVSVMPCTAKKFELCRDDQCAVPDNQDVDISITTRELARMIDQAGLMFRELPDESYDNPLGNYSGAGVIFGATGGVMEAALRTAVEKLTGEVLEKPEFNEVRGVKGIKTANYTIDGTTIKIAVASGLANAKELLEKVKNGEETYHFIEIMACEGGCVNGGGQIIQTADVRNNIDLRSERAKVLYNIDNASKIRKSHENPDIIELYKNYLGEPGSEKAHHILHTSYCASNLYK